MAKRLIRFSVSIVVLCAIWVACVAANAWYWQIIIGRPLEQALGFRHGTPYIYETGSSRPREVLAIETIVPRGVFDQAGLRSGDIVRDLSINGLFQALDRGRRQQVAIRVVDGGDGRPLEQRPVRTFEFRVPDTP